MTVKTLLERVNGPDKFVPPTELEAGARELKIIASRHKAAQLERLVDRLADLARTSLEMQAPVSAAALSATFKALERADPSENLESLEAELEKLEEEAFLFTPPIGNLLLDPKPVSAPARDERKTGGALRRVLSVDDSSLVRSALRRIFTETGIEIEEARNGEEARARFKDIERFDLVLLDINMPDISGIELLPQLRACSDEIAVVMLTSEDDVKLAIAAIRQGADGYIQKQDLPLEGDRSAFFHILEQCREGRAGLVARQQLEQLKADFYSMVTHDLKTPASIIGLALEQLRDTSNLTEPQRSAVEVAQDAAKDMMRLVVEYLDYARIDAGFLEIERSRTDLCGLVRASLSRAELLAARRGQTLRAELPGSFELNLDAERIAQVLENLIGNAVKYTPEGGLIELRLEADERWVRVIVRDTGNGFPTEAAPRLFKRYQRLPGESRRTQGTGLGLVIVKALVEAHGGRVWAESAGLGEGSTFGFELPR